MWKNSFFFKYLCALWKFYPGQYLIYTTKILFLATVLLVDVWCFIILVVAFILTDYEQHRLSKIEKDPDFRKALE